MIFILIYELRVFISFKANFLALFAMLLNSYAKNAIVIFMCKCITKIIVCHLDVHFTFPLRAVNLNSTWFAFILSRIKRQLTCDTSAFHIR